MKNNPIEDKKIRNALAVHGIYDMQTVSEMTGLKRVTLRNAYLWGNLPGYKIGGAILIRIDEVTKRWGVTPVDLRRIKRSN